MIPVPGQGPGGPIPELVHPGVLCGVVDVAAERRREVGVVAGGVRDEVVAPVVEHLAVRVGEAVGDVGLQAAGAWIEPEDAGVIVAERSPGGLDLGAVEDTVTQVNGAARVETHGVGGVVGVGRVESHQHPLLPVRLAVAVGVADEPDIGRLDDQDAILVELESGGAVQVADEGG